MTDPIHNALTVEICANAEEAIEKGFDWAKQPDIKPIEVKKVVVVRNGTVAGNATVDFVLEDESGQRFVFMVTGNLLKAIPC